MGKSFLFSCLRMCCALVTEISDKICQRIHMDFGGQFFSLIYGAGILLMVSSIDTDATFEAILSTSLSFMVWFIITVLEYSCLWIHLCDN